MEQCNVCIHMEIKVGNTLRKPSWSFIRMETIDNFDNWYPSWIQIMEVLEGEDRSRAEECGVPWLLIDDVSQVSTQAWSAEVAAWQEELSLAPRRREGLVIYHRHQTSTGNQLQHQTKSSRPSSQRGEKQRKNNLVVRQRAAEVKHSLDINKNSGPGPGWMY